MKTIGITGAGGSLGVALTKIFISKGYKIISFTHNKTHSDSCIEGPNEWVYWECGKEFLLKEKLIDIDILILNHGIYESEIKNSSYEKSLEVNALSKFRIIKLFEEVAFNEKNKQIPKEIWINTSEAEILPAFNPSYEISKSLIGNLASYKKNFLTKNEKRKLIIKKIIIGPFKSELNPIGIMSPELVALVIYFLYKLNLSLIIISPNPLTYILFPIKELYYFFYCKFLKIIKKLD